MTTISLEPATVYYQTDETHNSIRVTELHISSGMDLDERLGPESNTRLMRAAKDGLARSVELLLQAGARIDKRDSKGYLPLQRAAMGHHGRCVELIIAQSPDIHITEAMVHACRWSNSAALLGLMLGATALDMRSPSGDTPLTMAVVHDDAHCVELLLRRGADVNATNAGGWTPLAVVAMDGCARAADLLLAHPSIDVNPVIDLRGWSRVRELVPNLHDLSHRYIPSAMTPLLIAAACTYGRMMLLARLLKHAEVDTRMTTTGDAHGRLVEEIAPLSWRDRILEARRTQPFRSRRGRMAAFRIQRFMRDTTCNPIYAAARRSILRQLE